MEIDMPSIIDSLQASTAAIVQALKLAGAVLILRRTLQPYQPLPPKWCAFVPWAFPQMQSFADLDIKGVLGFFLPVAIFVSFRGP